MNTHTTYCFDDIRLDNYDINGLPTRVAELGAAANNGPTVLFLHGWPECWYSWRGQMVALANAGYRTIAPDMPGYAGTGDFASHDDYNIKNISEFLVNLITRLTNGPVFLVAHDWGAGIAWHFTLLHPELVVKLVTMSVPFRRHAARPPTQIYRDIHQDRFFYQLYFQDVARAAAEFDAAPADIITRLYCSPDTPRAEPENKLAHYSECGWIPRLGAPLERPEWLSEADLNYVVDEYRQHGYAGGISYYKNIDRNWELMESYKNTVINCPTLFIAGSEDVVIQGADAEKLSTLMGDRVANLTIKVLPGYGHWIQREAEQQVNALLVTFLKN